MTARDYERLSHPFRTPKGEKRLNLANTLLTRLCYAAYPLLVAWLAVSRDPRIVKAVGIPAVSFIAVSIFRHLCNAKRPYEVLDIKPLIHKDKKGQSFPSRHVFSMYVIAMTFLWILPPVGVVLLVMGTVLAACRVVGGVHWPRDVVCGAALGILSGAVLFFV